MEIAYALLHRYKCKIQDTDTDAKNMNTYRRREESVVAPEAQDVVRTVLGYLVVNVEDLLVRLLFSQSPDEQVDIRSCGTRFRQ